MLYNSIKTFICEIAANDDDLKNSLFMSCCWYITYLFLKSVEKWHILKDFDPFPVQFLTHRPAVPLITKMVSDLGECL